MKNYIEFLGLDKIKRENEIILASSDNREILLSGKFYYPIIATRIKDKIVISCTPKLIDSLEHSINEFDKINENNIICFLTKYASKKFKNFEIKEMYRLFKNYKENEIICNDVELINEDKKKFFYNIVKKNKELKYKEEKWKEFNNIKAPYGINYGIIKDKKIVSLGYISNIIENMANIVIQTEEDYRNLGFATKVVEKIAIECFNKGVIPIYWVNKDNEASSRVAKKTGFKILSKEIVIKIEK